MAKPRPEPGTIKVEIDEHWLTCWITFGLIEIDQYLTRHAQFDQWCDQHHRSGEQDVTLIRGTGTRYVPLDAERPAQPTLPERES